MIYWVVYAVFAIIEVFIDILVNWIPFKYALKLAFLLWAMLPQTKGAKFLLDCF
jgi:receptor expression-enhancing protein 5/6